MDFFLSYMFIPPYMFIRFWEMFPPACLFPPTRLLGTLEYRPLKANVTPLLVFTQSVGNGVMKSITHTLCE